MRRGKYSSEQILAILKEQGAGTPIADLCRTHGMHQETFYAWKRKYLGMQGGDVQKLRQLSEENARLKKVVGNMALEVDALKDALEKNSLSGLALPQKSGLTMARSFARSSFRNGRKCGILHWHSLSLESSSRMVSSSPSTPGSGTSAFPDTDLQPSSKRSSSSKSGGIDTTASVPTRLSEASRPHRGCR